MTEAETPHRPSPLAPVLAALLAFAFTAFAPQIFNDGDTFLHVAAGSRMLDARAVLHADPFSYTFAGRPWQTHEWLSEVVMALAFRAGGFSGVALLTASAAAATAGLLTRHASRWLSGPVLAAVVVLGLASLVSSLLARPHLLALPLLEMWAAELVIARSEGRLPSWRRLVPLMLVWANLHASFLFGLALLAAFGLEGVIVARFRPRVVLRWAAIGAAAGVAAMVSPHGIDNLLFPLRLMSLKTLSGVGEWSPMVPAAQAPFELALLAGVFALVRTRARAPLLPLLLLLGLTWLAFSQVRHVLLFGIVAPLLMAEPLGEALRRPAPGPMRGARIAAVAAACAGLALAGLRLALPVRLADSPVAPIAALSHTPAAVRATPVFNAYAFGGWLIFKGVRPYIDSRAEVYGDPFRQQYLRLASGDAGLFARELAQRHIGWTLLEPASPLNTILARTPGWTRLYQDRWAVVYARVGPLTPPRSASGPDRRPAAP